MKKITVAELRPFVRYARKLSADMKKFSYPICGYDNRLFYCTRGRGKIMADGNAFDIKQGVLVYIRAGVPYYYLPDEEEPMRLLAFNFDFTFSASSVTAPIPPERAERFKAEDVVCCEEPEIMSDIGSVAVLSNMGYLYEKLSEIKDEFTSAKMLSEQRCSGLMLYILTELILACDSDQGGRGTDTVDTVIAYLRRHYAEDISNGDLGERFGYHPNYLNQLFIRYTGKSLYKYLQDLRILKAIDRLQETDMAVSEVAVSVGFKDLPHFSRYFKQKTGHSPSDFR